MGMKVALCQVKSSVGEVGTNLNRIISVISQTKADLYIFPELFLTGYGADYKAVEKDVQYAIDKLRICCLENDIGIVVGSPTYDKKGIRNSLLFFTQDGLVQYDKLYLAQFGVYAEKEFTLGDRPRIAKFKDMTFGLSICYDIFFPEIYRCYAKAGADANICIAASAEPSKEYFDRIGPARSLENVMYTIFVNNIGKNEKLRFYGRSRLISPLGEILNIIEDEDSILCVYIDKAVVTNARKERRHMDDLRDDISWSL